MTGRSEPQCFKSFVTDALISKPTLAASDFLQVEKELPTAPLFSTLSNYAASLTIAAHLDTELEFNLTFHGHCF